MASEGSSLFTELNDRLQAQMESIEKMESKLRKHKKDKKDKKAVHWAVVARRNLLDIRRDIESLRDKEVHLKNKNKALRKEIFKFCPSSYKYKNWHFRSFNGRMANSFETAQILQEIGIGALPEMVFSHSFFCCNCGDFEIAFFAVNALKMCVGDVCDDKRVKVQYAAEREWSAKEHIMIKADYDWTFSSEYIGDYKMKMRKEQIENNVNERFNMDLLRDVNAPILWSCHCILYEDELSDNGMSKLLLRCRLMPQCFLILLRFWLRVDNVIVRINDCRIFHQFGTNYVLRHTLRKEAKWSELKKKYQKFPNDPNDFGQHIQTKYSVYDKLFIH